MTLFSSYCGASDSEDSPSPVNPRSLTIPAAPDAPGFLAVRYSDTVAGVRPTTDGDTGSPRSSQLSPRAGPPRCRRTGQGSEALDTPPSTVGGPQSVSSSVYSQLSHTSTPASADVLRDTEQGHARSDVGIANTVPDTARASQQTAPGIASAKTTIHAEERGRGGRVNEL